MPGCASLCLEEVSDAGLAAIAALALPRLTHLTALTIGCEGEPEGDRCRYRYGSGPAPMQEPPLPQGGLALAAQLSHLQRLEVFVGPTPENAWGPSADALAAVLARLPALRDPRVSCDLDGSALRRACDTLGADAWGSLQVVFAENWTVESLAALAQAPLTRLTQLCLANMDLGDGDPVCSTIPGAVWAPQLRELHITLEHPSYEILSDLQLPNLERLVLVGSYNVGWRSPDSLHMRVTGWHLPKLQILTTDAAAISNAAAASLAALRLPALTELSLIGALRPVLDGAVWATQLRLLELIEPNCSLGNEGRQKVTAASARAWFAALAAAPLTALSHLSLDCCGLTATTAAALGGAPWLRGLERAEFTGASAEDAAALRASCETLAELEAAGRVTFS